MKSFEMDMCEGKIYPKILAFALPLMLTGILQLLFNAADIVVIGQFAGDDSLAAVGSTTSIINFFVNIFMGLSIGTNVMVSVAYGAKNFEKIHRTVQTAVLASLFLGVVLAVIGFFFSEPILALMDTPSDIIEKAALYLKIFFLGMPAFLVFNYSASVLRAVGDTKRPLLFLSVAGVVNVALNLIFTILLKMDVAGVAIATIISQTLAMVFILISLVKTDSCYKYNVKEFKIYKKELLEMMKIGIPAAINGSLFSISNMIIQTAVNSFGSAVVAGNSVSASIEGFIYTSMDSIYHSTLAFTGQNYGARKIKRLKYVLLDSIIIVTIIGLVLGFAALLFSDGLFRIYTDSADIIAAAKTRAWIIMPTYFMCGIMNVFIGAIRGFGYSMTPTAISAVGILATRVVWIYTVFAAYRDIRLLYGSWPVSYIIVIVAFIAVFAVIYGKLKKSETVGAVPSA